MNTLFSYDGLLSRFCREVWKIFALSCCFVLCSLPIITVGAAASALYAAYLNEHMRSGVLVNYFRDFAANLRKGTCLWLIMLGFGLLLAGSWCALSVHEFPLHTLLQIFTVLATALYAMTLSFVFPLQAHFENKVKQTLKNAFVLGLSMPLKAITMALLAFLPVVLLVVDLDIFVKSIAIWVVLGAGLTGWINSILAKNAFDKLQASSAKE